jgi:DNA-binding GntR family transcriptional regulator
MEAERNRCLAKTPERAPGYLRRSVVVYELLKRDIGTQDIEPGRRLYETDIAARYGASRTPVREALTRLLREGLIEKVGRAYVVRAFSVDDVRYIYQVRESLECLAVRMAVQNASDDEIVELGNKLESMNEAAMRRDIEDYLHLDREFHLLIGKYSKNSFLESELRDLHDKVTMIQSQWRPKVAKFPPLHVSHERLYDAIRRRDATIAEAEMSYHLQEFITSLNTQS